MNEIQDLIAAGEVKDALTLLVKANPDALLLLSQYNNGERQYTLGMMGHGDWARIQVRVTAAALDMASKTLPTPTSDTQDVPLAEKPGVFISYNHHDVFAMRAVKAHLEDHNIAVFVDIQDLGVGDDIEKFIQKALTDNQFVLSIISQNSLKSGWVNQELSAALLLNKFGKKWLPVLLDKKCFEAVFYNETMNEFDAQVEKLTKEMVAALNKNRDVNAFTDELNRLKDLQNDFGKTIQALKSHKGEDIGGDAFEQGMSRIVKAIKGV